MKLALIVNLKTLFYISVPKLILTMVTGMFPEIRGSAMGLLFNIKIQQVLST